MIRIVRLSMLIVVLLFAGCSKPGAVKEMSALDLWRAGAAMKGQRVTVKGEAMIISSSRKDGAGKLFLIMFMDSGEMLASGKASGENAGPLKDRTGPPTSGMLDIVTVEATVAEVDAKKVVELGDDVKVLAMKRR